MWFMNENAETYIRQYGTVMFAVVRIQRNRQAGAAATIWQTNQTSQVYIFHFC